MNTLEQWLVVAFKVVDVACLAGSFLWVAVYTYLAEWWASPLGGTVVRLVLYLTGSFLLAFFSLFLHFNRTTSDAAGIIDVAFYAAVAAEMFRRVPIWIRLHMRPDGTRSYPALRAFAAEVWRRRGRPLWWDTRGPAEDDDPGRLPEGEIRDLGRASPPDDTPAG